MSVRYVTITITTIRIGNLFITVSMHFLIIELENKNDLNN